MIFEHTSYRSYLRATLVEKTAQNPRFSLRGLARQLDLSPAVLSQVISAKRNFSPQTAFKVAQKLELDEAETEYFCLLAQFEAEKLPELKSALHTRLVEAQERRNPRANVPRDLSMEMFKMISDWYHIPIVEMTELKRFRFSPPNVAAKLGISRNEAQVAIERLERLELIECVGPEKYRKTNHSYVFNSPEMSAALNKFHGQMLNKAIVATSEQKREERFIASNTYAIDPKLLPKAHQLIEKFRADMVKLFDSSSENTQTYHLGLQLFNLTDKT